MADHTTEEEMEALFKSIEIIKRDAEFNKNDEPKSILHPIMMECLKWAFFTIDPKTMYDKILSIEKNRDILKKDLIYIVTLLLKVKKSNSIELPLEIITVLKKYNIQPLRGVPPLSCTHLEGIMLIFPDIVYNLMKKMDYIPYDVNESVLLLYKNFKKSHLNLGIIGLLPKGKKYGGFVKAVIHTNSEKSILEALAICRVLYHSLITPHNKRENWFAKLQIKESDCILWSKTFDNLHPDYDDIHKYFEQIA